MIFEKSFEGFKIGTKLIHQLHDNFKAYKTLCLIRRAFKTNCIKANENLYISLARSQINYCSPIWRLKLILY